jgi:hypothetical protein
MSSSSSVDDELDKVRTLLKPTTSGVDPTLTKKDDGSTFQDVGPDVNVHDLESSDEEERSEGD